MIKPIFNTKNNLTKWVISCFPENYEKYDYIEPFAGSASVLLNKVPSEKIDALNDSNSNLIAIYKTIRNNSKAFIDKLKKIPYEKEIFYEASTKTEFKDEMQQAINEMILKGMSNNGKFTKRENKWKNAINNIQNITPRLQNVNIFNKPALHVINTFDVNEQTLIYCDPPENYEEHASLYNCVKKVKCKILITGKSNTDYAKLYKEWNREKKEKDIIWKNY